MGIGEVTVTTSIDDNLHPLSLSSQLKYRGQPCFFWNNKWCTLAVLHPSPISADFFLSFYSCQLFHLSLIQILRKLLSCGGRDLSAQEKQKQPSHWTNPPYGQSTVCAEKLQMCDLDFFKRSENIELHIYNKVLCKILTLVLKDYLILSKPPSLVINFCMWFKKKTFKKHK